MSLTWIAGTCSGSLLLALVLGEVVAQLGDDERHVGLDRRRAAHHEQPAEDRARHAEDQRGGAGPERVGEERREQRAAGGADEEHVDRAERRTHAPQAVRHDRLQHRVDHRERDDEQDARHHPERR